MAQEPIDRKRHMHSHDTPQGNQNNGASEEIQPQHEEMEELRRLLLGGNDDQVADLQERLDHIASLKEKGQLEAMSQALPQLISLHNPNNAPLVNALSPTIEKTINLSIRRNPQPFVDAIFPAIGPAIRRSIQEALKSVMDSINRTLEHSLSVQSIKWRMEAARTGRAFSEVVLSHTLHYRVEQLFLIDRKTGLPIQHLLAESVDAKDSDIISSMLKAIQDFVRDSFDVDDDDVMGSLVVGDVNVLVEPGPRAILAAVVRGIPTQELRETLKQIIEAVHLQFSYLLDTFQGDPAPFSSLRPLLRTGFLAQYKNQNQASKGAWILIGLLLLVFLVWAGLSIRNYLLWSDYVTDLKNEPGIVVTETGWRSGRWVVEGLKDPMARSPESLAPASLPLDRIEGHWDPYLALDPTIVVRRATQKLQPPEGLSISLRGDTLTAAGSASSHWVQQARDHAEGILGVSVYDDEGVSIRENERLIQALELIERTSITFDQNSSSIRPDQEAVLDAIVSAMQDLATQSRSEGIQFRVHIAGHASTEGSPSANIVLSQMRAESVREAIIARGIAPGAITTLGTGAPLMPDAETSEAVRTLNRSASFHVRQF